MELEEFVEQDILIFLDERIDDVKPQKHVSLKMSSPVVSHDFESEFFAALDTKNIALAKQVLNNLKIEFDSCPSSSADKIHLKSLLLDLYEKFKDYLDAQNTFSQIQYRLDGPSQTTIDEIKEKISNNTQTAQTNVEPTPPPELFNLQKNDINKESVIKKQEEIKPIIQNPTTAQTPIITQTPIQKEEIEIETEETRLKNLQNTLNRLEKKLEHIDEDLEKKITDKE